MRTSNLSSPRSPAAAVRQAATIDQHVQRVHLMLMEALVCSAALISVAAVVVQRLG